METNNFTISDVNYLSPGLHARTACRRRFFARRKSQGFASFRILSTRTAATRQWADADLGRRKDYRSAGLAAEARGLDFIVKTALERERALSDRMKQGPA